MANDLAGLEQRGLIARKRSDPHAVTTWLERSRDDVALSRSIAASHPYRCLTIAYEAGLRACAGILATLKRLDLARRYRNDDLYGEAAPPSAAQLDEATRDAEALVDELDRRLRDVTK